MKSAQEQEQAAQWEASNPFGPLVWAEMLLLTYHGHQLSRPTVFHLSIVSFFSYIKRATAQPHRVCTIEPMFIKYLLLLCRH